MPYFITFLEGIITFISPCLLPMIPIYITYFAGGNQSVRKTVTNALGFVSGFTAVFVAMGALAGTLGGFLKEYQMIVNIVTGAIVVFLGLSYLGVLRLKLFRGLKGSVKDGDPGLFSSILFGIIFSLGWTPCVGAFLGSALMLASQQAEAWAGILLLLCYSLGLGLPFMISAVLIDRLKAAFDVIKRNYRVVNVICGLLLIAVGVLMMTGLMNSLLMRLGSLTGISSV